MSARLCFIGVCALAASLSALGNSPVAEAQWNRKNTAPCFIRPDVGSTLGVGLPAIGNRPPIFQRFDNPFFGGRSVNISAFFPNTGCNRPNYNPRPIYYAPTYNYGERQPFWYPSTNLSLYANSTSYSTTNLGVNTGFVSSSRSYFPTDITPVGSNYVAPGAPPPTPLVPVGGRSSAGGDAALTAALLSFKSRSRAVPVEAAVPRTPEPLPPSPPRPESEQRRIEEHLQTGDALFHRGDYRQARDTYSRAMVIAGEDPGVRIPFGMAEFALGRYSDAARALRAAVSRPPLLDPISIDVRRAYGRIQDFDDQVRALEFFINRNPFEADALFLLGFVKACSGNLIGGRACFEKYAALRDADPAVRPFIVKVMN